MVHVHLEPPEYTSTGSQCSSRLNSDIRNMSLRAMLINAISRSQPCLPSIGMFNSLKERHWDWQDVLMTTSWCKIQNKFRMKIVGYRHSSRFARLAVRRRKQFSKQLWSGRQGIGGSTSKHSLPCERWFWQETLDSLLSIATPKTCCCGRAIISRS